MFVNRFYVNFQHRKPDPEGLKFWVNQLVTNQYTAATLAQGAVFSAEFIANNVSDSDFLDIMYNAFYNRAADSGGKAYWQGQLDNGMSRLFVLANFVNSDEFSAVCATYGITRGSIQLTDPADLHPQITQFVNRFYAKFLQRKPDPEGLNYWVNQLVTNQITAADLAKSTIFSDEFIARNVSNSNFLDIMYSAFYDRVADSGGKAYWLGQLDSGMSRLLVLANFVNSNEFSTVCATYGITRGNI
jgi:hypothetical protein